VTRARPGSTCILVRFSRPYTLAPGAEIALEDYARVLLRADAAEAAFAEDEPGQLLGVHVCAPGLAPDETASRDVEAFAAELAAPPSERLGWS